MNDLDDDKCCIGIRITKYGLIDVYEYLVTKDFGYMIMHVYWIV